MKVESRLPQESGMMMMVVVGSGSGGGGGSGGGKGIFSRKIRREQQTTGRFVVSWRRR